MDLEPELVCKEAELVAQLRDVALPVLGLSLGLDHEILLGSSQRREAAFDPSPAPRNEAARLRVGVGRGDPRWLTNEPMICPKELTA